MMGRILVWVIAVAVISSATTGALGQEDISAARPVHAEDATVVAVGRIQIELGVLSEQTTDEDHSTKAPEGVGRFGVLPRTELRFGYDHSWVSRPGEMNDVMWARYFIGGKIRLTSPEAPWRAALIPVYRIREMESEIFRMESVGELDVRLSLQRVLSPLWTLGSVLGVSSAELPYDEDLSTPDDIFVTHTGLAATRTLSWDAAAFLEWAGDFTTSGRNSGTDTHFLHGGMVYRPLSNAQIDVHAGLGLNDEAPNWSLGVGLAYRAPE